LFCRSKPFDELAGRQHTSVLPILQVAPPSNV
jgi:hypothetical protein